MARKRSGKSEQRLTLAILVGALFPLTTAILLADSLFANAASLWFPPEVGQSLDRGVTLEKSHEALLEEDARRTTNSLAEGDLDGALASHPRLIKLRLTRNGTTTERARGAIDETKDRAFAVVRDDERGKLEATFALPKIESSAGVATSYHSLERSRPSLYRTYAALFGGLLGVAVFLAVVSGLVLARGVTRRIHRIGDALDLVAKGDLTVRVTPTGNDEVTDLETEFNAMLDELAASRARIEFLQRIAAWQEMAQRLAHEIKNPLTPILLAVQECHRKYEGTDPKYRALLDTTVEVVEEEVATLRRLVGDFSNFARLPRPQLEDVDLRDFLRDCGEQLAHLEDLQRAEGEEHGATVSESSPVTIKWEVPSMPLPVAIDRQLLRRVLVNLVQNAADAIRDAKKVGAREGGGRIIVSAVREGDGAAIVVDDDGPGISPDARNRIFDPYYTTKTDGTGLGLAIVKKIVVEHGGTIEALASYLGGAAFWVHLPGLETVELLAARESTEVASP